MYGKSLAFSVVWWSYGKSLAFSVIWWSYGESLVFSGVPVVLRYTSRVFRALVVSR